MKQTRTVAGAALVALAVALVPAAAAPRDETPDQTIARMKTEAAQLRMQLNAARMTAKRAKVMQTEMVARTRTWEVERDILKKDIAALKATVAEQAAQNLQVRQLLAVDAKQASDVKVRDALAQLVLALKSATKMKAVNDQAAAKNKKLQAELELMAKALLAARRELAAATTALDDVRQELAIEKGKRIVPATTTGGGTKRPPVEIGEPIIPKPKLKIATKIRTVSGQVASIGVGSDAGLRTGMKLLISRGNDYVATLVLTMVERRQAAGNLVDVRIPPKSGDTVGNMP